MILVWRQYRSELDPTWLTTILYRYQDLMEELLSPTVTVPEGEQGALNRFRRIYGQSLFTCRHNLCKASNERFSTTNERGKHEQSHFERWRCDCPTCPFFVKGLASSQALKAHNQKHHPVISGLDPPQILSNIVDASSRNQENDISAKEASQSQLIRCRGTLPSGTTWGCGESFLDSAALRAHWVSPSGLKCKDALREGLSLPPSGIASTAAAVGDPSRGSPLSATQPYNSRQFYNPARDA